MDVFVEQLVKRKKGIWDYMVYMGLFFFALFVLYLTFYILVGFGKNNFLGFMLSLVTPAGAAYLIYRIATSTNIEYEYCVTNGELDVDKIIAQRKRVRLFSVNVRDFETFEKYDSRRHKNKKYSSTVFAGTSLKSQNLWSCTFRHDKLGSTLLIFEPEKKVLDAIIPYLPRQVANNAVRGH